jgi:hypothetical protein
MSAKKKTVAPAAPAAQETTPAQAPAAGAAPSTETAPPADAKPSDAEPVEKVAAPEPVVKEDKPSDAEQKETEPAVKEDTPAPQVAAPTVATEEIDEDSFVASLLSEFLEPSAVDTWSAKVLAAIRAGKLVSIVSSHGSNVLEIHRDALYSDRNSVRSLSAVHGESLKAIINQTFLAKFPAK